MIQTSQVETLLHALQHKAEQSIQTQQTSTAVILLIYHDNIKTWLAAGQVNKPPVSAADLAKYDLPIPDGWHDGQTRLIDAASLREFPNLSPTAFQHPFDIQAITAIQAVPLLESLLRVISESVWERQLRLHHLSTTVRLGPNQGRSLYQKFVKAAQILDLPELPEIYVSNRFVLDAYTVGIERYQVTLFSGLIDSLSEAELMVVIGHELGHIKCQHMLYRTMAHAIRLLGVTTITQLLPTGTGFLAAQSLLMTLLHWERMAEFSCDRASLLVVQDPDVVASALTKVAGGSRRLADEIQVDEVLRQAEAWQDRSTSLLEQVFRVRMMVEQTHPFPVVRAKEIVEWSKSAQYAGIMAGNYARTQPPLELTPPQTGSIILDDKRLCARCQAPVFKGWQRCPTCQNDLQG